MGQYLDPPEQFDNPTAVELVRGQFAADAGGKVVMDGTVLRIWAADPRPLAGQQASMLAALADRRWAASLACTWTFGGNTAQVPCDTEAASNVMGAIMGLQLANSTGPVSWKVGPAAFVDLALNDLVGLGQTMRAHVQGCYSNEAKLAAAISTATQPADLDGVDIEAGWPS